MTKLNTKIEETNLQNINPEKLAKFKQLRLFNALMALLHFGQGLAMLILSKEFTQTLFWNFPSPQLVGDPDKRPESIPLAMQDWFKLNLGQTIAVFLLLSALAHLITILPQVYSWYVKNLQKKMNLIRWFEYAISSSVMILVIAILCNIRDAGILIPLVLINTCMNLFGASMEVHNSKLRETGVEQTIESKVMQNGQVIESKSHVINTFKVDWSNFIYGCFAGIVPWVIMAIYFYTSLDRLGDLENLPERIKNVLNTVKLIFPTLFIFFNCFALNMLLQYKGIGKWKDYLFGERIYILLSLVAKSILAWFIFGGTLR
jgi:hypothetical protein